MTSQFCGGAQSDSEAADELRRRAQCVAFSEIGRDGYCRSANLIGQPPVSTEGTRKGQRVRGASDLLAALPRLEGLELSHDYKLLSVARLAGIYFTQLGAGVLHPPFPIPLSPFPGV